MNRLSNYRDLFETCAKHISDDDLLTVSKILWSRNQEGGLTFVCGNGGSATTASHFALDLGVGSCRRGVDMRAISLSDSAGNLTATSNDVDFSKVYSMQLQHLAKRKDTLVVLSASGQSENLIEALNEAKRIGLLTVSLTGFSGGEVKRITDYNLHVETPKGEYGVVEDLHLSICHRITEAVRILGLSE